MISILFLFLAGIMNAVMDTLQFRYSVSIFSSYAWRWWADPRVSWMNKWKDGKREKGEAFLGSSTVFVWTTDLWHFAQSLMISFFVIGALFYSPIVPYFGNWFDTLLDFLILKVAFSMGFEIFWSKVFVKQI